MAGALIASLPILPVYIVLGRWFIGGLMAGRPNTHWSNWPDSGSL